MELEIDNKWKEYIIGLVNADISEGHYTPDELRYRVNLVEDIRKTTKWVQED